MQLVIQSSALPDFHLEPFVRAAEYYKIPVKNIGIVPFTREITGLDEIDPRIPTVFYGSTRLVELIHEDHKEFEPGVWFDPISLAAGAIRFNNDMLNEDGAIISLGELHGLMAASTSDKSIFVRPTSSLKSFAGRVFTRTTFKEWWDDPSQRYGTDENTEVRISTYKDIWAEWRFFVIDGEVVTGSLYREGTLKSRVVNEDMILIAQCMANQGLPLSTCVMDLCMTPDGIKIVEFNSVNASGLYDCDPFKIINAIQHMIG